MAANTRWAELFHDPLVERQRAQETLTNGATGVRKSVAAPR